jgi:hypothetical protein
MRAVSLVVMTELLVAPLCPAATIHVPEDSPTVLAAVDLAMPGDSVLVGPGVWTDAATRTVVARNGTFLITACAFPRGGVVIRGEGAGLTTLDAAGSVTGFPVVICLIERSGQGILHVESMSLTGAGASVGEGRALAATYSDGVEARSCRFEGNVASSGAAVGVLGCPLTMADCDVIENTCIAGVVRVDLTPVTLSGCRFEGNSGRCLQTNFDVGSFVPAIIQDCEFVENRGRGTGVCLNLQNVHGYAVEGNVFLRNVAEEFSGAAVRAYGSSGVIRGNIFAFDSCYAGNTNGGAVRIEGGSTATSSNTFVGCHAGVSGAAFAAGFGASGEFTRNAATQSTGCAAVILAEGTSIMSGCNLFWQNPLGEYEGGVGWSGTDLVADPLFCDPENLDFTVQSDSPCILPPTPSCAPIGAMGVGCGMVSVRETSFGRVKALFR